MKRGVLIKLVIFLLLGAVVNVGVAWGCTVWATLGELESGRADEWMSQPLPAWPHRPGHYMIRQTPLVTEKYVLASHQHEGKWWWWRRYTQYQFRAGFPCHSLKMTRDHEGIDKPEVNTVSYRPTPPDHWWEGLELPLERGAYRTKWFRYLPVQPLFPGFLINTACYAVILWLLWSTPFTTRRLIRKRRGRCVKCGYDLKGMEHDVCPECGARSPVFAHE